jgi:hypothetical protein
MLANELQDLHADEIDLALTGFDADELSRLLGCDDAVRREEPVELKQLAIQPPPPMTWVLIGIPTVRFGQINQQVEQIALLPDIICEVAANNG